MNAGSDHVMCEVMSGVKLGKRKNCNLPGVKVGLPGVDFVAASFMQSAQHAVHPQIYTSVKPDRLHHGSLSPGLADTSTEMIPF